jgi:hypothetical protein
MSAGHGGHHVAQHEHLGEREFDRAMADPRFQAILSRGFDVSFDYDVPYLGGYSQDGTNIYIDRDTPLTLKRGKHVYQLRPQQWIDASSGPFLVRGIICHEHWEKTAMMAWGWGYYESHKLATHAENRFACDTLQMDSAEYEEVWQPVINMVEKKLRAQAAQLPPDLDRTPYQS